MAAWGEVKRIVERMTMDEKGELHKVYHADATTVGGITFSMDIPEDELDADHVDKVLGEKAANLDALLAL